MNGIPSLNVVGFNEYQELCAETDLGNVGGRRNLKPSWMYYLLGIGGETGELFEKIKKGFRDGDGSFWTEEDKESITKEMGDILWYMASLADHLGIAFGDVPRANVKKLFSRKDRNMLQGNGDNR